jgi:hypothetical protein
MGPIIELITSYENRITTVEEVMMKAYQATVAPDRHLDTLDKQREQLQTDLQKTLARRCSLRKKDFDKLLKNVLADSNEKREALRQERERIREQAAGYVEEHRRLADYLRGQLADLSRENADGAALNGMIKMIRTRYEESGQRLFGALREFQAHLEVFQREQEELNARLQRLADRGDSIHTEDLRQLEAARADQERKADRGLRREEVDRLLAHFRQQRLESRMN